MPFVTTAGDRTTLFALPAMICCFKLPSSALHSLDPTSAGLGLPVALYPAGFSSLRGWLQGYLMEGGSFVSLHELLLGQPACGHIAFLQDTSQWVLFSGLTILLSYMGYPRQPVVLGLVLRGDGDRR